jgi:hypothetical protein
MTTATLSDLDLGTLHNFVLPDREGRVKVVPTLGAAEELMDWLDANGYTIVDFDLHKPDGFVVTWR